MTSKTKNERDAMSQALWDIASVLGQLKHNLYRGDASPDDTALVVAAEALALHTLTQHDLGEQK